MKTKSYFFGLNNRTQLLSLAMLLLMVTINTGCRSSSGSRWAFLNPFSGGENKTLVAATAPALPSDSATPQLEGAPPAETAVASNTPAETSTAPKEPSMDAPAFATNAPSFNSTPAKEEAQIAATPQLAKSTPEPASSHSYPMAAIPEMSTPKQTAVAAQASPYDPNGYQESAPAQVAAVQPQTSDRYGNLGNRYASAPAAQSSPTPEYNYQPATTSAPSTIGDRYGSYASTPAPTSTPTPTSTPVAEPTTTQPYQAANTQTTPSYSSPVGSRYASAPSTPAPETASPSTEPTATPYATAQQAGGPLVAEVNAPSSEVQLVSAPGQYRPGGTSSYDSQMNIATKPEPYIDSSSGYPGRFTR